MFYKNYPRFLDSILKCFTEDYKESKTIDQIKKIVFKDEISKGYDLDTPDENVDRLSDEVFTYTEYLIFALSFLHNDNLVVFDEKNNSVTITTKGFFKIKTEGFEKKISNDRINLNLQRAVWVSILLTFSITIYNSFKKTSSCSCTTSKNCSYNTPTQSQSLNKKQLLDITQTQK